MSVILVSDKSNDECLVLASAVYFLIHSILHVRGVIKKFVEWCNEINTYEAMLTNFVGNINNRCFNSCENWSQLRWILIILSSNTNCMVWSPGAVAVEFRDVPQRHCFSMLLSLLYITLWLGTQKSNTILIKQSFTWILNMNINFFVELTTFYK